MKKAKFWVDWLFEAGSFESGSGGNICHRYSFDVELTDDEFEELYQVWYDKNGLNNWDTDWQGHDALYEKLNPIAYRALNDLLKQHEPDIADTLDAYWEISQETIEAF